MLISDLNSLRDSLLDQIQLVRECRKLWSPVGDRETNRLVDRLELRLVWALLHFCPSVLAGWQIQWAEERSRRLRLGLNLPQSPTPLSSLARSI